MGSKGNDRHVKRLASPRYLHIEKKENPYILKPNAGRHTFATSIALSTVIIEKLKFAQTAAEVRRILKAGSVEVNGKSIKDPRYSVGFGDIIHFKPSGEKYEIGVGSKGIIKVEKHTGKAEAVHKVVGKYIAKSNKEMLRLYSGVIIPSTKGVSVGDSVVLKEGKVHKVMKLEKGAKCLVVKGVHASLEGTISEINRGTALRDATVEIHGHNGKTETLLDNIVVVGAK